MERRKEESEDVKRAREMLNENQNMRVFAYAILDDKYGTLFEAEEQNVEEFLRGEDQKSYEKLTGIIEKNAAEAKAVRSQHVII
jgi:hypothetical protein